MTKRKPPPPPAFGALLKLGQDGWDGVPDGPDPFYFGAKDGLFLHRRGLLGRGIARVETWPEFFPKVGTSTGMFWWEAPPIPAVIMSHVVTFFERIYAYQHTEAMVLLCMNQDTKEWRAFIPTQLVSHGGVNYVFDPTHIALPWVLVGTIHSHCDFGAGHSGTDTKDAEGFDGFHATIGMIKRETPQIVAMVAMNKRLIHYQESQFPLLFDFSEVKKHQAPAWWDRYVEDTKTGTKPIGYELYKKFNKPTGVGNEFATTKITPVTQPQGQGQHPVGRSNLTQDWVWNQRLHRLVHKSWVVAEDGTITFPGQNGTTIRAQAFDAPLSRPANEPIGYRAEDWDEFYRLQGLDGPPEGYEGISPRLLVEKGYRWAPRIKNWEFVGNTEPMALVESRQFNARRAAERGVDWDKEGALEKSFSEAELREMGLWSESEDKHWEELLPPDVLELLFDSDQVNEDDIDFALRHPDIAGDPEYWQEAFLSKTLRSIHVLRTLGLNVSFKVTGSIPGDLDMALLPETATPPEDMSQKGLN